MKFEEFLVKKLVLSPRNARKRLNIGPKPKPVADITLREKTEGEVAEDMEEIENTKEGGGWNY